ncbi:MAG: amidohydrolase [Planctomycetes bacterium]|nr:amidohydrolase [Planctomycetota bacterium]
MMTVVLTACLAAPLAASEPKAWVSENVGPLFDLYKHLHQYPELSLEEKSTSQRLTEELRKVGVDVGAPVGGYGIVGLLISGEGPRVMIRADMDALPVVEQTGVPYASKVSINDKQGRPVGVMHACGHDIHMTCLIGTAQYLAANKDQWRGSVMFVGQPAEESGSGARKMIDDHMFSQYRKPDFALALHCSSQLATGKVGYRPGHSLANVDSVDITLYGRGGHGAYPHTTIDPVVQAAHLIVDLQSIVSREMKPTEPAVVTVGSIHGGTRHNIIGERCQLQLTVRSFSDETRKKLQQAIIRKAKAAADSAGAPEPKVEFSEGALALWNDEALVTRLLPTFRRVVGEDNLVLTEPSMGGEDFSQFAQEGIPIFQFQIGTIDPPRLAGYQRPGMTAPSLHSPRYYPDAEPSIVTGVSAMTSAVLELLGKPAK